MHASISLVPSASREKEMPASKSSTARSPSRSETSHRQRSSSGTSDTAGALTETPDGSDRVASLVEQLVNRIFKPLDLVVLTRERIQETLDEAAERGRLTRSDANALVAELVRYGRQQTDELFRDMEQMLGRGRSGLGSATRRARRTVGLSSSPFPISDYDELTAGQVTRRLGDLSLAQLRRVREYERRHANRKSVLAAVEKALG
jgi:polyhydroxyalkanoate synthesis regulator phasin